MRHHPLTARLLGAVALTCLVAGTALVAAAPAQAAACSGSSGVTVVVQFPDRTETRCAPGNPSSGFAALTSAGFSLTFAQGNGAGALCRIDGVPQANPCTSMPPANAYWAYFRAKPGGSWSYSNVGGGSSDPAPGSVEGWRLGDGKAPSTPPPSVSTPTPKPKPKPKPTPKPSPKPSAPAAAPGLASASASASPSVSASASASALASASPSASVSAPAPVSASASPSDAASTAVAAGSAADDAEPASTSTSDGGLSWVWGLVLLVVLGGAGAITYLRRRQA